MPEHNGISQLLFTWQSFSSSSLDCARVLEHIESRWETSCFSTVVAYIMKGKPRKASSGGSTLTVPLLLVAAIFAGFFFVIYALHLSHISTSDIPNASSNKFTIVERKVADHADPVHSETSSPSSTLRLRATDAPTTHPTKQRIAPEATSLTEKHLSSSGLAVKSILDQHPFHSLSQAQRSQMSLEDHFVYLRNQTVCKDTPIFTSMANVFSDLYWQL